MSAKRSKSSRRGRRKAAPLPPPPPRADAPSLPNWTVRSVLLASAAFGGFTSPLFAQDSVQAPVNVRIDSRRFDIPAGSLAAALEQFAKTTGLAVTDPKGLVGDLHSSGLQGVFSDEDALRQLLLGRGITYRFTNARAIRLELLGAAGPGEDVTTLPTISVKEQAPLSSPKYTEPLRDVPQSIAVVPKDVIEAQGATTLRDVVRNVPGLTVNAGEGGSTPGDNFNLRGFSARNDIFVDGVRTSGGYSREMFNVEQVEVTKGPASSYVGRGSTGGAINLVTKTPQPGQAYRLTAGLGTADYRRANIDLNQPLDRAGLPGVAVRLNADLQDAGVAGLPVVKNNGWGIAPSLAIGLGSATQFIVEHAHSEQDNIPTYGVQSNAGDEPPPVDTRQYFGLRALDFEKVNVDQGSARFQHIMSEATTLRNQLLWSSEDVHRIVSYAALDGSRRAPSHITKDATLANQTTLTTRFDAGATRHALTAGVEIAREKSYFGRYVLSDPLPSTDVNHPDPNQPYTGTVTVGPPRRDVVATSIGAYLFETASFGEHWEVSGSVRWDRFDPTYRDTTGVELTPHTTSEAVSWRAGAVFKPQENGSIYAAYGTSFNPSGEGLAYDATGTNGIAEPEKNRSFELGTKWDFFRARLLFSASVFRTEKTNARMTDPDDPLGEAVILAGKQRVDGVEFGATGRILPDWMVYGGYMWLRSKTLAGDSSDVGLSLDNTPPHSVNLWTTYRLPWELEIGGGARHIGRRTRLSSSGLSSVPPYWAFDAEMSYPVTPRVLLRLNLINLTDAEYYDNGRFWVPAAGRSVRLTTSLTY